MMFEPTQAAGQHRLTEFIPRAGRDYASLRNYDRPGHDDVSRLSPYLRHRIICEDDVLAATLAQHSPSAAEKFIQEIYWRTYWKGWLEQRPAVWARYCADLASAMNRIQSESGLRRDWEAACKGETGIECFDHWAHELADSGYLHNHARMWFASIWVFTLRLPWELGADFFLRHLLDGDPASNTLGWRWVAGAQTVGKTYLARPDNIAKYTDGRFRPRDLATWAVPVDAMPHPDRQETLVSDPVPNGKLGLLISEDDLSPEWITKSLKVSAQAAFNGTNLRSPLVVAPLVNDFVEAAIDDLAARIGPMERPQSASEIDQWAQAEGLDAIVMSYPPIGATADALKQVKTPICRLVRSYDAAAWPHASAGFFKFKTKIPKLLSRYDKQLSLI